MIVVDTSVWVAALRTRSGREAIGLASLLDRDVVALAAPVRVELLTGASRLDRPRLRRVLSALPLWYPKEVEWQRIDAWIDAAAKAGERFGVADMLIASIAVTHEARVWTLDGDFARMERLGLVATHSLAL